MNAPSEDFKDLLVSSFTATGLIFKTDLFIGFEPEVNPDRTDSDFVRSSVWCTSSS